MSWWHLLFLVLLALFSLFSFPLLKNFIATGRVAFITSATIVVSPEAVHSRYRRQEYTNLDNHFFQWWNFIIFDDVTKTHFTIGAGIVDFPRNSTNEDYVAILIKHLKGSELLSESMYMAPLTRLRHENDFDLFISDENGNVLHSHRVVNNSKYILDSKFDDISFHLEFERIAGFFDGLDTENPALCTITSSLYGFHSSVTGTLDYSKSYLDSHPISAEDSNSIVKGFKFTGFSDKRFRAYAAGSWGCDLPGSAGKEDFNGDYPWTWAWLSLPEQNIGVVAGYARFEKMNGLPEVEGRYIGLSVNDEIFLSRGATLMNVPLMSTSFPKVGKHLVFELDTKAFHFERFEDKFGVASLPTRQTFKAVSDTHSVLLEYHIDVSQYYRLPISIERNRELQIFSDFRAVGCKLYVKVERYGSVLFDGWVYGMNAVEYAYIAPYKA